MKHFSKSSKWRVACALLLLLSQTTPSFAQDATDARWNFVFGAIYGNRVKYYDVPRDVPEVSASEKYGAFEFSLGFEAMIPIKNRLSIETGLRYNYRNVLVFPKGTDLESNSGGIWNFPNGSDVFTLPVRMTYNYPIGENGSIHLGVGPYISYSSGKIFADGDDTKQNRWQVGLEPSAAYHYKSFNVGLRYNLPLYKGYNNLYNNWVEFTIGFSLHTSVFERFADRASNWNGDAISDALLQGAQALDQMQATMGGSTDSGNNSQQSGNVTTHNNSSSMSGTDQLNYNNLRNTYNKWADDLTAMRNHNGRYQNGYTENDKRHAQEEMKRIRDLAKKKWGKEIPYKSIEDWK